jgi:hypothetical protein
MRGEVEKCGDVKVSSTSFKVISQSHRVEAEKMITDRPSKTEIPVPLDLKPGALQMVISYSVRKFV